MPKDNPTANHGVARRMVGKSENRSIFSALRCGQLALGIVGALALCIGAVGPAWGEEDAPGIVKINGSVDMAPLGANVYLVTTAAGNVVIDTGTAAQAPIARKV